MKVMNTRVAWRMAGISFAMAVMVWGLGTRTAAQTKDTPPQANLRFQRTPGGKIEGRTMKGTAPLTVTFSAEDSTDAGGRIVEYRFDVGGKAPVFLTKKPVFTYTYNTAGAYTVWLVVVDNWGNESKPSDPLQVFVDPARLRLIARRLPSPDGQVDRVQFRVVDVPRDGALEDSFTWNFGDGTPEVTGPAAVVHDYQKALGPTTVVARGTWATDDGDLKMDLKTTVDLKGPLRPILKAYLVKATSPETPLKQTQFPLGETVGFTANGSRSPYGKIVHYEFDLTGDDTFEKDAGALPQATVVFDQERRPFARVRVTDEHGNQGIAKVAFGFTHLLPVLEVKEQTGPVGRTVTIDCRKSRDLSTGRIPSIQLEFGKELALRETEPFLYRTVVNKAGRFPVKLTAMDSAGNQASVTVVIEAGGTARAVLEAKPTSGLCSKGNPLEVALSAEKSRSAGSGLITGYEWDMDGDGTFETRTGSNGRKTIRLEKPGLYVIRLRVTDEAGQQDTDFVEIRVEQAVSAAFDGHAAVAAMERELGWDTEIQMPSDPRPVARRWLVISPDHSTRVEVVTWVSEEAAANAMRQQRNANGTRSTTVHGFPAVQLTDEAKRRGNKSGSTIIRVGKHTLWVSKFKQLHKGIPADQVFEILYRHAVAAGLAK